MDYIICEVSHGCNPASRKYSSYEEAKAELDRLNKNYPSFKYKYKIEKVPDISEIYQEGING